MKDESEEASVFFFIPHPSSFSLIRNRRPAFRAALFAGAKVVATIDALTVSPAVMTTRGPVGQHEGDVSNNKVRNQKGTNSSSPGGLEFTDFKSKPSFAH